MRKVMLFTAALILMLTFISSGLWVGIINIYDEIDDSSINSSLWDTETSGNNPSITEDTDIIELSYSGPREVTTNIETLTSNNLPEVESIKSIKIKTLLQVTADSGDGGSATLTIFGNTIKQISSPSSDNSNWTLISNYNNSNLRFDVYDDEVYDSTITPSNNTIILQAIQSVTNPSSIYEEGLARLYFVYYNTSNIILNSPIKKYNSSTNQITFNASTDIDNGATLTNMSLWTNESGTWERKNTTTGLSGTSHTQTWERTITEGSYIWNVEACDSDGNCTLTQQNRTLTIDNTKPQISVEAPSGLVNYGKIGNTGEFNVTFTDNLLDSCWYNYNGTNITIEGCLTEVKNSTTFIIEDGNTNMTIYSNDSAGNINSTLIDWDYLVLEESSQFSETVVEGIAETFSSNLTLSSTLRLSTVNFFYNGTSNIATFNEYETDKYTVSITHNIPTVTTNTNFSFYWNLTFENGQSQTTSNQNQTVINFGIDDCSAYSNVIFNLTMVDEDTQLTLDGAGDNTIINVDIGLSNINTLQEIINFSHNYTSINPAAICLESDIGDSELRMDGIIEYKSTGRFTEYYNIQNYTLTNETDNQSILLYNLNSSEGQEFTITYKDSNFNTVPGAIIQVQRNYIEEGVFKTVEIPKIGGDGTTVAHLIRNDIIYNLIIIENGTVLGTFNNVVASCQNPALQSCEININSFSSGSSQTDFTTDEAFTSTISYNKTTRVVSTTYAIISGVPALTSLNVTLWDSYLNESICSDGLNSAGGSLSCTIPSIYVNNTVLIQVISDGVVRRKAIITLSNTPENIYGDNLVFVGLIILITIIGMSVSDNPIMLGIMLIFGSVMLVVMNITTNTGWIGGGATILWFIIAIIIILIKGSNRQ